MTARRHWFRVADSVAREDWSNDVAATFLRLGGALNTRWARDGLNPADACEVVFRPADLMALTGSRSLARARRIVRELAVHLSIAVDEQGANTRLQWPKWAEFQKLTSPEPAEVGPEMLPKLSPPPPPPQDAIGEESGAPPIRPKAVAVGVADARDRQARTQVARALMRAGPESPEKHAERESRLDILAEMFLVSGRVADEAQLRGYFRGTAEIPTAYLRRACDEATAASERGFAPAIKAITSEGRRLVVEGRKRVKGDQV